MDATNYTSLDRTCWYATWATAVISRETPDWLTEPSQSWLKAFCQDMQRKKLNHLHEGVLKYHWGKWGGPSVYTSSLTLCLPEWFQPAGSSQQGSAISGTTAWQLGEGQTGNHPFLKETPPISSHTLFTRGWMPAMYKGVLSESSSSKENSSKQVSVALTNCRLFLFHVSAFRLEFMFWKAEGNWDVSILLITQQAVFTPKPWG